MNGPILTLTEADTGSAVDLHPGDQFLVVLSGNPTTGYQWLVSSFSAQVLCQPEEPRFQQSSDLTGSGGSSHFLFEAAGTGQTTLHLVYRRPFEKGKRPARRFKVVVCVSQQEEPIDP
jgi:inhibitor of cysteine peptidase